MAPASYKEFPQIVREYLFYTQTIKGRSERTVQAYAVDLKTFFRYLNVRKKLVSENIPFEEIEIQNIDLDLLRQVTLTDLYEFLHFVSTERNNSAVTRSRKVSSLKSFFHYLTQKKNLLDVDPTLELEVPNVKKSLPKYLSLEQCLELLQNVEGDYQERDYCMITLFLNCGMRLSELVKINLNDISDQTVRLL